MNYENKEISYSIRPEALKTPRKFLNLGFSTIEALEKIPSQLESKQNKKIAKRLTEALIEGETIKIVFFPRGFGFEAPPFWSGHLGEDLKVFLGAIFPHKNQKEVTKAIRERREIFFKLGEELDVPVDLFASVRLKSAYNEFSERKKAKPIGLFTLALSDSLRNKEKIEIPLTCLEAEKDLRTLLKIIFKDNEDNKDNKTCQQIINILEKGRKIVLKVK